MGQWLGERGVENWRREAIRRVPLVRIAVNLGRANDTSAMAGDDDYTWAEESMGRSRLAGGPRHESAVLLLVNTGGYPTEQGGRGREKRNFGGEIHLG
jgi:hypothetical protein